MATEPNVGLFSTAPLSPAALRIEAEFAACGSRVLRMPQNYERLVDLTVTRILGDESDLQELLACLEDMQSTCRLGLVFNQAASLRISLSKFASYLAFSDSGVPTVPTDIATEPAVLEMAERFGLPLVLKPEVGLMGRGITRHQSTGEVIASMAEVNESFVVQPYIPTANRTLRILVACGNVVASAVRSAQPPEWRANYALGATMESARITSAERDTAIAAVSACGLDIGGVDIVRTPLGSLVLEVNPSPGLLGIESVGGNVARKLVEQVLAAYSERRSPHPPGGHIDA